MSGCEYYQELVSRMLDGDLSAAESAALMEHLDGCPECAVLYRVFYGFSEAIADDMQEPPEGLRENIMAEIRREDIRGKNSRKQIRYVRRTAAAAACLAIVMLAAFSAPRLFSGRSSTAIYAENAAGAIARSTAAQEVREPDAVSRQEAATAGPVGSGLEANLVPVPDAAAQASAAAAADTASAADVTANVPVAVDERAELPAMPEYVYADASAVFTEKMAYPEEPAAEIPAAAAAAPFAVQNSAPDSANTALFTVKNSIDIPKLGISQMKTSEPEYVDMTENGSWKDLEAFLKGEVCVFSGGDADTEKYCLALTVDGKYSEVHVFIKGNEVFYRADIPGGDSAIRRAACSPDDFRSFLERHK